VTQTLLAPPAHRPGRFQGPFAVLIQPVPRSVPVWVRTLAVSAIVIGAGMVAASALIHLHLWFIGYRHIARIGPLFLAQAITGIGLAAVLTVYRRLITVIAGVTYLGGSLVALLISATVGFLGLHDGLDVPWAGWSVAVESTGFMVLLGAAAVLLHRRDTH
jgi:hypothetical protein